MSVRPDPLDEIEAALTGALVTDDEAVMVRRAALRDPPLGCPMTINGQTIEPGAWHLIADEDGLPPGCPVKPLGMGVESGEAWFIDALGRLHGLKASASGKGPIEFMFAGRLKWLPWAFPRWRMPKTDTEEKVCIGYDADEARRTLIDACGLRGVFSEEDKVRGRGAWRDDDGTLIYHAGDAVWIGGKWVAPGEHGGMVYPARPSLERPWGLDPQRKGEAVEMCLAGEGSPGDVALQTLLTWNWDRGELDARLALGWSMTAMVGGALDQRPNLYADGEEGSGKSTLQKVLRALMGGALVSSSNTTQAGVYQKVRNDSVAVFLDESEASVDPRVSDRMLQLARIAYSGDKMLRGGADHHGKEFTVMSSFLFSSIARPAMDAQDLSRMALLTIRPRELLPPREGEEESAGDGVIDLTGVGVAGRQLLRRWVLWWDRWELLRMRFWKNLRQRGHSDRSADTFAALAAGCHVALHDDMPDAAEMGWWMERLDASLLEETAGREKTWQRAFMHVLTASPEVLREKGARNQTLGDYVRAFKRAPGGNIEDLDNALRKVGLALSFPKGYDAQWDHARLFVPCKHPAVNALFTDTNWVGRLGAPGPWTGVLRQAPRNLWEAGVSRRGYVTALKGTMIHLAAALDACAAIGDLDEDTSRS